MFFKLPALLHLGVLTLYTIVDNEEHLALENFKLLNNCIWTYMEKKNSETFQFEIVFKLNKTKRGRETKDAYFPYKKKKLQSELKFTILFH